MSVVIINHASKQAAEIDIPEERYQNKVGQYRYVILPNVIITPNDVVSHVVDYQPHSMD